MCLGVLVVGFKGCYLGGVLVVALWLVVVLFVWLMWCLRCCFVCFFCGCAFRFDVLMLYLVLFGFDVWFLGLEFPGFELACRHAGCCCLGCVVLVAVIYVLMWFAMFVVCCFDWCFVILYGFLQCAGGLLGFVVCFVGLWVIGVYVVCSGLLAFGFWLFTWFCFVLLVVWCGGLVVKLF